MLRFSIRRKHAGVNCAGLSIGPAPCAISPYGAPNGTPGTTHVGCSHFKLFNTRHAGRIYKRYSANKLGRTRMSTPRPRSVCMNGQKLWRSVNTIVLYQDNPGHVHQHRPGWRISPSLRCSKSTPKHPTIFL